ncbi:hypothetical protein [Chryseobacterium sp. CT-SW4]|uniref:hypothetical protein n=1 Tax=Chryseobacterium sp. SW-1 TaxID=3157343 RepID=UPI003B0235F2
MISKNNENIVVRTVNIKFFFITILIFGIITFLLSYYARSINYTINQTYFLIFFLSAIVIVFVWINFRNTKLISLSFGDKDIKIFQDDSRMKIWKYDKIKNYNMYRLWVKPMGHMLRLRDDKDMKYYWIVWLDTKQISLEEEQNIKKIEQNLLQKLSETNRKQSIDYIILFLASLPFVLLIMALFILIGGFIYIIFYLK